MKKIFIFGVMIITILICQRVILSAEDSSHSMVYLKDITISSQDLEEFQTKNKKQAARRKMVKRVLKEIVSQDDLKKHEKKIQEKVLNQEALFVLNFERDDSSGLFKGNIPKEALINFLNQEGIIKRHRVIQKIDFEMNKKKIDSQMLNWELRKYLEKKEIDVLTNEELIRRNKNFNGLNESGLKDFAKEEGIDEIIMGNQQVEFRRQGPKESVIKKVFRAIFDKFSKRELIKPWPSDKLFEVNMVIELKKTNLKSGKETKLRKEIKDITGYEDFKVYEEQNWKFYQDIGEELYKKGFEK